MPQFLIPDESEIPEGATAGLPGQFPDLITGRAGIRDSETRSLRKRLFDPKYRGIDPRMLKFIRDTIIAQGSGVQTGFKNQSDRTRIQGGFARHGSRFNAIAGAANAASTFMSKANRELTLLEQQTGEQNRRFDIDSNFRFEDLRIRQRAENDRRAEEKRKSKFNPIKFAFDLAKTGAAFVGGGPPAAAAVNADKIYK